MEVEKKAKETKKVSEDKSDSNEFLQKPVPVHRAASFNYIIGEKNTKQSGEIITKESILKL